MLERNTLQLRKYLRHTTITSTVADRLTVENIFSDDEIADLGKLAEIPFVAGRNVTSPHLIAAHDLVSSA